MLVSSLRGIHPTRIVIVSPPFEGDVLMNSALGMVYRIAVAITVIASLNLGLVPLMHYNPLQEVLGKIGLESLFMPAHYIIGIAGLIVLFMMIAFAGRCHCCQ